ncbi:alpha/beta fold hydrolase, partial [Rhizobium sp. 42MFCr.1]|uniref:alpha/beta fold hydrolase n=1 Tax=Rhizobium sp. 42MFCr.1 TaxID=1048680 RepID=UPI0012EC1703
MRSLIMCLMLAAASMIAATVVSACPAQATTDVREAPVPIHYRTAKIDGLDIFYREAGPADAPVVLLLHGFPTSSHMFRNLIPLLADRYHVVAPDYPGYGQSATP